MFEEDIGRHNALDKIIGKCLYDNVFIKDKIVITSGRITSEVILKCAKIGIPYIVSRSAPTNLAIDIAKDLNIGLIGFARGNKMNIYF
jgi:FdhD protein